MVWKNQRRILTMKNKTVVVGMSGGVDSSVAAYLLKNQGYDVIGVTMQIWQEEDSCTIENAGGCCGLSAVDDARRVAHQLDIPYYVMNFRKEFQTNVIDYFVREYRRGRTPNPCIACNRYVKWESLLDKSLAIGADYIATGHYARIKKMPNGRYSICRSGSLRKDQTYALYNLTQRQLEHTLFPVGEYEKEKIRDIAETAGLQVAHKPDSQEICFVPGGDYALFIEQETGEKEKPGNFVDIEGKVIGTHKGIGHYTIGQRKGLGIAFGEPVFVVEIRTDTNEVVLGKNTDVFSDRLRATGINYMAVDHFEKGQQVLAKIRYNHEGARAVIRDVGEDFFELEFPEPVRAVTPGQAVVLYDEESVLGGGTIC
jgi:tRNA-specific 2-thiouridylase